MRRELAPPFAKAAMWGACATWIFWWLFDALSGALLQASVPAVSGALRSGWSADQIQSYLRGVLNLLSALLYGLMFGFPLGLIQGRFLFISWLGFVVGFIVTIVARMLFAQVGASKIIESLIHPIYWLTALATLLFLFIGNRLRLIYAHRAA